MNKRLAIIFLLFVVEIAAQICEQHNRPMFNQSFNYLSYESHRRYPVSLSNDQVRCIIVPAAHDHQAQLLLAATYQSLQDQIFENIIVICSSDTIPYHGVALPIDAFSILFDRLRLAEEAIAKLAQSKLFHYDQQPFCMHCGMQQQLEFICCYLHANAIIPMMVGAITPDEIAQIALIIGQCICKKSLIIISADIGNYHHVVHDCLADSSPICVLYDHDAPIVQAIQSPQESPVGNIFDHQPELAIFGIFCHLIRLPEFKNIQSLFVGYATSFCNEASFENLATYAAFMVQDGSIGYKNLLGSYEQSQLLQHARKGLYELFNEPDLRLPSMISYEMMQPCGLFTSLYRMSDHGPLLQGCMGKVQAKQPLYKMAYQMAQQAACKDVRFYPLRHKDLESTIISVSVICDLVKIKDYDEICPSDGLMLKYDDKKAICLPDLRPKIDWSYESALIDVSRQLGNHHFIWKKPRAKIFKFRSIVFQEE